MIFTENLNRLIKSFEMSLSKVAKDTGIPKSTLHGYTCGVEPSLSNLNALADYFKVTVDHLAFGRNNNIALAEEVCRTGFQEGVYEATIKNINKE